MRLRESIDIRADAVAVWPLVADPLLQAEWNPKIVSIDRRGSGPARFGERYDMIYRMSGRETLTRVEVAAYEPSARIVFRHHTTWKNAERIAEEEYQIQIRAAGGVRVVQTIDLSRSGIPRVFQALMWLIHRVGWSTEEPYLRRLKRRAEESSKTSDG